MSILDAMSDLKSDISFSSGGGGSSGGSRGRNTTRSSTPTVTRPRPRPTEVANPAADQTVNGVAMRITGAEITGSASGGTDGIEVGGSTTVTMERVPATVSWSDYVDNVRSGAYR